MTRGEATGVVTSTGSSSFFGRTSELVAQSRTATHLEGIIFQIVRYLVVIDVTLVAVMFAFAAAIGASFSDTAPFALIILIASVPVALPTTFTVAQAVGALELSRGADERHRGHGVLVTRLSAVQEGASMDVLCTDKTGTLTLNELTLEDAVAYAPFGRERVCSSWPALASDESGQDPIDLALLRAAHTEGHPPDAHRRLAFVPFDPSTKRTEAVIERDGQPLTIVKGMPQVVADAVRRSAGFPGGRPRPSGGHRRPGPGGRRRPSRSADVGRPGRPGRPAPARLGPAGQRTPRARHRREDGHRRHPGHRHLGGPPGRDRAHRVHRRRAARATRTGRAAARSSPASSRRTSTPWSRPSRRPATSSA